MTDHKVSDFVTKKSYHAVTLVSNYPVKAISDTIYISQFYFVMSDKVQTGLKALYKHNT